MNETKHDLSLTPVDVAEGRALVVVCPDCGQLEIWSEEEALVGHGLCRAKGRPCWCEEGGARGCTSTGSARVPPRVEPKAGWC